MNRGVDSRDNVKRMESSDQLKQSGLKLTDKC